MKNKFTKKIIAGRFKGQTLNIPSKTTTRSSKAIVLESFFNTIQFDILDAHFVEVFSGSGSIGLEALSRGACHIYFMEQDKEALKILKKNIAQTDPSACEVFGGDSFTNINSVTNILKRDKQSAFFYIDPPFSIREGMEDIYDKTMKLITDLDPLLVRLVIIEHMTGLELPETLGELNKGKSKKFGNTSLTYYMPNME